MGASFPSPPVRGKVPLPHATDRDRHERRPRSPKGAVLASPRMRVRALSVRLAAAAILTCTVAVALSTFSWAAAPVDLVATIDGRDVKTGSRSNPIILRPKTDAKIHVEATNRGSAEVTVSS